MSNEWPLWEIFIRGQHGMSHRHVGSLHAPDAEMAIKNARDVYTRRNEGVSIWVVEANNIAASDPNEKGPLFDPSNSKVYRHPTFFDIPDEVDDATAMILEEIGEIGIQLTNGEITVEITKEEFQYFWKRIREGTASSYSGIHYGHYKAAAHSEKISNFLSKKITVISRTGCPPERWSYGLRLCSRK